MKINLHISDIVAKDLKSEKDITGVPVSEIVRRAIVSRRKNDAVQINAQLLEALEDALAQLEYMGGMPRALSDKIQAAIKRVQDEGIDG